MSTQTSDMTEEIRSILRSRGLRATSVRLAVLGTLRQGERPMSHERVMGLLPAGNFDRASVWRVLSDLTDHKLLKRMDLGDRVWRFEFIGNENAENANHGHFICTDCGDVNCLPDLVIRTPSGRMPEFLQSARFNIRLDGVCGKCVSG